MKRLVSLAIILALLVTQFAALSEMEEPGETDNFFGSIGGFITNTWDDATKAVGDMADSVGETAVEAWNSTSTAITDAWDWTSVFISDQYAIASESANVLLGDLQNWVNVTGEGAAEVLESAFEIIGNEFGIAKDKMAELWNAINAFAREKNISVIVVAKLALAVTVRLTLGGTLAGDMAGGYISDTVMQWFADNNIDNEESAERALAELEESIDKE